MSDYFQSTYRIAALSTANCIPWPRDCSTRPELTYRYPGLDLVNVSGVPTRFGLFCFMLRSGDNHRITSWECATILNLSNSITGMMPHKNIFINSCEPLYFECIRPVNRGSTTRSDKRR